MEIPRHNIIVFILLLIQSVTVFAQQARMDAPVLEQAQKKFEYGLLQYELSAWSSASRIFEEVIRDLPLNQRTTAAYLMAARAHLMDGKASRALRLIEELRREYPTSTYLAEACIIAGDAAVATGSPSTALLWYVRAWLHDGSDREYLASSIRGLNHTNLSPVEHRQIREILSDTIDPELASLLQWEKSATKEGFDQGKSTMPARDTESPVRIVAALPQHENDRRRAEVVRDLREGILAALDVHRDAGKHEISLELLDSRAVDSLPLTVERLDRDERTMVLIAGAFSEDAEMLGRAAAEKGMLVLLPTATADGLANLGSNVFQLNTPILQRARLLADFALLELAAEEALVIAPRESYAHSMAEAFMERCREIGLDVRYSGWYKAGGNDVGQILRQAVPSGAKNRILFAPVQSRDDIVSVLKGISDAQFSIPIIGAGNWNHPDILQRHGRNVTLYFESDVVTDSSTSAYREVASAFARRTGRPLSREAMFGADAMRIALNITSGEQCSRKKVRKRIADVFDGIRAPVNFLQHRINAAMNIVEFRDGSIKRHEAFHAK